MTETKVSVNRDVKIGVHGRCIIFPRLSIYWKKEKLKVEKSGKSNLVRYLLRIQWKGHTVR